jgi:hypothetical protein
LPTVLRIGKHRFFFFSNEGNEPPHIHVETVENYAKFWLEPVALARSIGYNPKDLRELRKLIEEHKSIFLGRWHEYFGD